VEAKNLFKSLQCNYLRAVAEIIKITPTEIFEMILCSPSLVQLIVVRQIAYRLKGEWKD